ncbi:hypothetical protein T07_12454 [Trichinella nelsoni]|uniref:Uncharacterized protein n=1 Tax=Trichinella nelsoni TaxID=6336 RepID=A0A0V0RNE4_9BILA|nr:hypothetical protein T07_12454 [Trichinella nelsoni]
MAFPHRRSTPLRARLPCGDYSVPLLVSGPSLTVSSNGTSQGPGVIQAHSMLGHAAWAGLRTIRSLEPSVMVISRACQSITLTNWLKKFVPKIPGMTRLSTTATCICPLQFLI